MPQVLRLRCNLKMIRAKPRVHSNLMPIAQHRYSLRSYLFHFRYLGSLHDSERRGDVGAPRLEAREGIEPPTRGFSVIFRGFEGLINQSLAASCRPLRRHTKAHSWHTQYRFDTFL